MATGWVQHWKRILGYRSVIATVCGIWYCCLTVSDMLMLPDCCILVQTMIQLHGRWSPLPKRSFESLYVYILALPRYSSKLPAAFPTISLLILRCATGHMSHTQGHPRALIMCTQAPVISSFMLCLLQLRDFPHIEVQSAHCLVIFLQQDMTNAFAHSWQGTEAVKCNSNSMRSNKSINIIIQQEKKNVWALIKTTITWPDCVKRAPVDVYKKQPVEVAACLSEVCAVPCRCWTGAGSMARGAWT